MQFIYTPVPFIYMSVIWYILPASNLSDLKSEAQEFSEDLKIDSYHTGCFYMVSTSHAPLAFQSFLSENILKLLQSFSFL